MRLEDLAAQHPHASPRSAPAWLQGCFRRRSITFYNGVTDSATEVWWLQAGSLCADLRIQPNRPRDFLTLVQAEGGIAQTTWTPAPNPGQLSGQMSWHNWTAFQLHDKWNEAATLHRVGDAVIEFAPSGAYVEDWRLQPRSAGLLAGLHLIDERNAHTGELLHRGGGLIVCGDHAALILGRPTELASNNQRLADLAARHAEDPTFRTAVFSCEASYARREANPINTAPNEPYRILHSTNPALEGTILLEETGFTFDTTTGHITQHLQRNGQPLIRRFTIDTLQRHHAAPVETPATATARAWLARESDTLLAHLEPKP